MRVLVVDDNRETTRALAILLSVHGHAVDESNSGRDALAHLSACDVDVILLDMNLGDDVTGFDVVQAVRANATRPQPYIVAMTGNVDPTYPERAQAAGCNEFVLKPMEALQLTSILARATATALGRT